MSHPLELPTGQQRKGRGASTPLGYWLRLANFLLGDCGVSVCACVCVSEQRKRKTKCFFTWGRAWTTVSNRALIPVAIFSSFSTERNRERWEFRRKSLRFNYMLHVHRMGNSDLWKHQFMILPCKTNAFMSSLFLHINKGKSLGVW